MNAVQILIVSPSLIAHFDDVKETNFYPSLISTNWRSSSGPLNEILLSRQCILIINEILQLSYMQIHFA